MCNAHHLRELIFFHEQLGQTWAGEFKILLLELKEKVEQAKAAGATSLTSDVLSLYQLRYQKLLLAGLLANPPPLEGRVVVKAGRPKQSKANNLLDRLQDHRLEVLALYLTFRGQSPSPVLG